LYPEYALNIRDIRRPLAFQRLASATDLELIRPFGEAVERTPGPSTIWRRSLRASGERASQSGNCPPIVPENAAPARCGPTEF
jgi:hypothetical protein